MRDLQEEEFQSCNLIDTKLGWNFSDSYFELQSLTLSLESLKHSRSSDLLIRWSRICIKNYFIASFKSMITNFNWILTCAYSSSGKSKRVENNSSIVIIILNCNRGYQELHILTLSPSVNPWVDAVATVTVFLITSAVTTLVLTVLMLCFVPAPFR